MEGKLQELTNKIYQEGLEKARRESAELLAAAQQEADRILAEANKEAQRTRTRATEEAEALRKNAISELQLAGKQAQSALRQEITNLISGKLFSGPIDQAFDDASFFQSVIEAAVKNWDPAQMGASLQIILPEAKRKELEQVLPARLAHHLEKGLELRYDENLQKGFRIGPSDGRFIVSFTPDDFDRFFRQFLRPQITQLLFGS